MTTLIDLLPLPLFAVVITLLFTAAFSYAITDGWSSKGRAK